jgi:hypothetical protein
MLIPVRHAGWIVAAVIGLFPVQTNAQIPYADTWPKTVPLPSGTCASVTGRYEYRGEPGQKQNPFPSVNFDNSGFNRMSIRGRAKSSSVVHDMVAGVLTVTIDGDELSPPERVTFTRQVNCVNGWNTRVIEARDFGNASAGHVNFSRTEDRYGVAEDGSFIVHRTSQVELRNAFSEPEKRHGEWWYRFNKLEPTNAK